jgi:hypothetical protein
MADPDISDYELRNNSTGKKMKTDWGFSSIHLSRH